MTSMPLFQPILDTKAHNMDVLLWQAMCGHNTNGSVGLHKHTRKLKQRFSLAEERMKTLLWFTSATFFALLNISFSIV